MKPKFFGQFLVEKEYITQQQLFEALEFQQKRIAKIGEIAVQKGIMSSQQAEEVNMAQRKTDKFFGELAIEMGYLTREELERIITIQRHSHIFLGEVIVEKGFLTRDKLDRYLAEFHEEQKPIASLVDIIPEQLELHDEVFTLLDISIKIFRRMANLYLKVGKGFFKSTKVNNLYLITSVYFSGSADMRYFINVSKTVAETITKNLYRDNNMDCDDETICDCIGELVNVICGNAHSQILELGQRTFISPPEKMLAIDAPVIEIQGERQVLVFPATVPVGYLEIGVMWGSAAAAKETLDLQKDHTVLIVDDSALCRRQLSEVIENLPGYVICGVAKDGQEAVDKFAVARPDIVIIDLIMPGMPGEEVIRRIRALDEKAKIIVMSGVGGSANKIFEELSVGVVKIISKPIDEKTVGQALVEAMS